MKYSISALESISSKLDKVPAPEKKKTEFNKQEAIKFLYRKIKKLNDSGYTIEQISKILNEQGVKISLPTFKAYLQKAKHGGVPRKKKSATTN